MRILFYAVDGLGLGHVTRTLAIARQVRALEPAAEILFLTASEADNVIYREGFAAVKLPSKTIRRETRLRASTYGRLVSVVSWNAIATFNPHVLVVDTFPAGAIHELLPLLRWDMRKVFIFRAQRAEHAHAGLMQSALRLYDRVLIPHSEGEAEIPVPPEVAAQWVGPILIRSRDEALGRREAREALGLPAEGTVIYATFGGGGDQEIAASVQAAEEACARLAGSQEIRLAVACGPLFREAQGCGAAKVTWLQGHYPMALYLRAFDAAIAATGYNTATELLHVGVPTVFIPYARTVDDQEARAARIAAAGAGLTVPAPEPDLLAAALRRLLDPGTAERLSAAARALVPENGAERAARAILDAARGGATVGGR